MCDEYQHELRKTMFNGLFSLLQDSANHKEGNCNSSNIIPVYHIPYMNHIIRSIQYGPYCMGHTNFLKNQTLSLVWSI